MKQLTRFVEGWAWTTKEEKLYAKLLRGYKPVLHLFSGHSKLGDVRVDMENFPEVTHRMKIKPSLDFKLPFRNLEFDATIFDPPWINQYMLWTAKEVPRVTRRRIVAITGNFWWEPHRKYPFKLTKIYVVKTISPAAKLVFVYDRHTKILPYTKHKKEEREK